MSTATQDCEEAKCRRCGECCRVKYLIDGVVFNTTQYCEYFDAQNHLCRIYDRRREINPRCLDVATGIRLGVFPTDCPYVAGMPNYKAPYPVPLDEDTERAVHNGAAATAEAVIRLLKKKEGRH